MTTLVRAAVYRRHGPAVDTIELSDWDIGSVGPGEVRVAVEASPVHLGDLMYVEGRLANAPHPPAVAGSEGIGRVIELGAGVGSLAVGQRVFLPRKRGTFIEQVRVRADELTPAPERGNVQQLSLVPINALTSYLLVTAVLPLEPGSWILQNAANSSCGRFLIGIARKLGFRTINVVRRPELVDELLALGADEVVVATNDLAARVEAAVSGEPIRYAIDAIAGAATAQLARCLAIGGTIAVYGLMSGEACRVPADLLFLNDLRVRGYFMPHYEKLLSQDQRRALLQTLGEWVADGELSAKIAASYDLTQVRDAFRHELRSGSERDGKVILLPNA